MKEQHIVILDAETLGDGPWPEFTSFGKVTSHKFTDPKDVNERIKTATIVLSNKVVLNKEAISVAPHLQYIGSIATGFNQVDLDAATERKIVVCNAPGYSTFSVMQHTFALMLDLASGITLHANAVANGEWGKSKQFSFFKKRPVALEGKTLGLVGYGNIGIAVGRLAHAFGMNVVTYVPRAKPSPHFKPFSFVSLDELFEKSDFISLHCPLTSENKEMIDAKAFAAMKKTAYLINCSRGELINEQDLYNALVNGEIAGAGLDVVQNEPMQDDHILRHAPNCLITPHIAWASGQARENLLSIVFENVQNFIAGSPTNVVND